MDDSSNKELELNNLIKELEIQQTESLKIDNYLKFKPLISSREPINSISLLPPIALETNEFIKFNSQAQNKVEEFLAYQFDQKDNLKIIESMVNEVDLSYLQLKPSTKLPKVKNYNHNFNTKKCEYSDFINEICKKKQIKSNYNNRNTSDNYNLKNPLVLVDKVKLNNSNLIKLIKDKSNIKNGSIKRNLEENQFENNSLVPDKAPHIKVSSNLENQPSSGGEEEQEDLHDSFQDLSLNQLISRDEHTLEDDLTQMHILDELIESFKNYCQLLINEKESSNANMGDYTNNLLVLVEGYQTLTNTSVKKLDSLFTKLISYKLMDKLDHDYLIELTELLKFTIDSVNLEFVDFNQIKDSKRLPDLEAEKLAENELLLNLLNGLICANLLLQISLNNIGDSKLNNEDLILSSVKLVKHQLSKTIVTCLDSFNASTNSYIINLKTKKVGEYRRMIKLLNEIFLQITSYLSYFKDLLKQQELNNEIIIGIGYCSICTLFLDTSLSTSIFTNVGIDTLKSKCSSVVQLIFVNYEDQRDWILDEVLNSLIKLPTDKRLRKDTKLSNGESIQMTSSFLLQLVQSNFSNLIQFDAFELPNLYEFLRLEKFDNLEFTLPILKQIYQKMSINLEKSLKISKAILNYFFTKLTSQKLNTDTSDYKQLFQGLIEDFCICLDLPEWFSSELMLRLISIVLIGYLEDTRTDYNTKSFAIEALGLISFKLSSINFKEIDVQLNTRLINSRYNFTSTNFKLTEDLSTEEIDFIHFCIDKVYTYLSYLNLKEFNLNSSSNYWLSAWFSALIQLFPNILEIENNTKLNLIRVNLLKIIQNLLNEDELTKNFNLQKNLKKSNFEFIKLINLKLIKFSKLLKIYTNICSSLIKAVDFSNINLRSKALRSISNLTNLDSLVLSEELLNDIIIIRFNDQSSSVRDIAIDILGKFILSNIQLGEKYLDLVYKRIQDTSLLVRKRTIKLLSQLYYKFDSIEIKTQISLAIFKGLNDTEKSIKLLSVKTLKEFWFSRLNSYESEGDAQVYIEYKFLPLITKKEINSRIQIIVGLVKNFTLSDTRTIGEFIFKNLKKPEFEKKELFENWKFNTAICQYFIEGLLAHLLYLEETQNQTQLSSTICALHIFGIASPQLFDFNHLSQLQNYLQLSPSSPDLKPLYFTLTIYKNIIPSLRFPRFSFLKRVENQIFKIIDNFGESILEVSLPCLCTIVAETTQHWRLIIALYKACFQRLIQLQNSNQLEAQTNNDKTIIRLLLIIGLLSRHIDIDSTKQELELEGVDFNFLGGKTFIQTTFDLIIHYLNPSINSQIRSFSIRSLGLMFVKTPNLILNPIVSNSIEYIFKSKDLKVKTSLMQTFHEFVSEDSGKLKDELDVLEDEEDKPVQTINVNDLIGANNLPLDSGICANLMQAHLNDILECLLSDHDPLANHSLNVVGILLTSGYCHPLKIIPNLVAVQTNKDPSISKRAIQYHTAMVNKYPSFIHSATLECIKSIFNYQKESPIAGYRFNEDYQIYESKLHHLYQSMQDAKQAKKEFINLILNSFDINSINNELNLSYFRFLSECLTTLDYKLYEDVIYLIHQINQLLSVSGSSILERTLMMNTSDYESEYWAKLSIIYTYLIGVKFYLIEKYELDKSHFNLIIFEQKKVKEKNLQIKCKLDPKKFWNNYSSPSIEFNEVSISRCFEHLKQMFVKDAESVEFEDEEEEVEKPAKLKLKPKNNRKYDEDDEDEYIPY